MPALRRDYHNTRRPPRLAYIKSTLPVLITFVVLSFGLGSYAYLSTFRSPAFTQGLGWQAWDVVAKHAEAHTISNGTAPSLPLDIWDPMALHTTGLTEIIIQPCYMSPILFASYCRPASTPEDDKLKGQWVMVQPDLNAKTGLWYLNVWYRRTRRLDVPLIAHVQVLPHPPPASVNLEGWTQARGDLHEGLWPSQPEMRLWYKTRDQFVDGLRRAVDDADIITELSVHYGDEDPFFGYHRIEGGKVNPGKDGRWDSVDIVYRRGNPIPPSAPLPRFHVTGDYKVMQIADLHYSVGPGKCKDTDKVPCTGEPDTAKWLGEALDAEKPDLVVFSGDQLNGQKSSYDARSVLAKFARPVIDRHIPWAAVFGNHDSEIAEDREEQMVAMQHMPYSLARAGPSEVDGVGNYDIRIYSPDASRTHIFTLYFLDSHSYQKTVFPVSWARPDYDYIKPSQIDWFLDLSASVKPIERPFHPDGGTDLDPTWSSRKRRFEKQHKRQSGVTLAKPNAIMFFHIPLPEAYLAADITEDTAYAGTLDLGVQEDREGASGHNGGFFSNAVQQALEQSGSRDGDLLGAKSVTEVKVISHGHCHNTDRCRRVSGVWMCFDGGSSYAGYGEKGFDRRIRVYNISDFGETVSTYKRLTTGEIVDRQVLVGQGAAPGWGQVAEE